MFWPAAQEWIAGTHLARRVVDTVFLSRARRHVAALDRLGLGRCQARLLRGLVHRARATRFGRDHDFGRIRGADDFRRLVPLRTPADLWREYWQPAFPHLAGATWPGPIPYVTLSAVEPDGLLRCVAVSPQLLAAHRAAADTALAYVAHARPRARLFAGRLLWLGGGTSLTPLADQVWAGSLEAIAARELPAALRPYLLPTADRDGDGEQRLQALAASSARLPVTCLAGAADRLARFVKHLRRATGRDRLADVWPGLTAVLYARGPFDAGRAWLEHVVGDERVLLLETCFRPEGAVAVEDPRHGLLRLLPDHGVYFEFVPLDQLGKPSPARYGAGEVEPGVAYALAVTSPAGLWACLVGSAVRFARRDPPLLRLVDTGLPREQPAPPVPPPVSAAAPAHPFPAQPPHGRGGTPGWARNPSAARGERG